MLNLPQIAMGAWAWGNDGTFGDNYTAGDLKEVYQTAMKCGLNLWDIAALYGMGTSEERAKRHGARKAPGKTAGKGGHCLGKVLCMD